MDAESRGVRPWEAFAVLLGLSAFAVYMVQWGLEGVIHNRKTLTVPDLRGRSLSAAVDMISQLNLGLRKSGAEFDSSVPILSVLRQEPAPGTIVREGKVVKVVLSQGGETVLAPSIVGLPLRNAEMLLRQTQLTLGEVSEAYSLKQEKGMVLAQDPKAESSVERNAMVGVVVSGGPPPAGVLLMPDFLRKNVSEAQAWAAEAGLKAAVRKDTSSLFPSGVILTQEPAPDSVLSQEAKIAFVVSGRPGTAGPEAPERTFHYELSQGGSASLVRIVVVDRYGERELFNGLRQPGSKIDLPIQETGGARVKIFVNGILVEERDL